MTGKGAGLTEEGLRHKIEVVQGAIRRSGFDRSFSFREEGIRQADTRQADTGQAGARQKAVKQSPGSETAPDAIEVLRSVGGFDLLGMCGLYLGGWICQIPVLIDGFASSVAALAAVRICPACADAILASHRSSEPAAGTVLEALGKKPLITGNLHLGEGTGTVLAMPMLDMALSVYKESVLFGEGGVRQYREL
jgi:nicotinate-nucleotide--dimethylbenzimidazole phosphoribosyltransferase